MKTVQAMIVATVVLITSACSTTAPNISGLVSSEIYPVNSEPRQWRRIKSTPEDWYQLAQEMVSEGYSSFFVYQTFNAWTGINEKDREAALATLSKYLCFGPTYTTSIRSSAKHSGNVLDPGRYGVNHIEALITCNGKQPEMVALQNQEKLRALEQKIASQQRTEEKRIREQEAQALKEQTAARESRERLCLSFGFKPETEYFSSCLFDLYKFEQQAKQTEALIAERKAQNKIQEAAQLESLSIQRQVLDEQRFWQGMQQLQNAARIINPPQITTRCLWNNLAKTMTCD